MSRDEFLDGFLQRAGIPARYRTADGIKIGSFHRVAVPCAQGAYEHEHYMGGKAGSVTCSGWELVEPPARSGDGYGGGVYSVTRHI